jgi:hypothetical protein
MINAKRVGNEYENKINQLTADVLGVDFKRTKMSGGGLHKGDSRDWTNSTPLKRYCQEMKKHGSIRTFNKSFKQDIRQAISQTPADKNWQLITHLPSTPYDIVVMDYQDYLFNDILGQMVVNNKDYQKTIHKIENGLRMLKTGIEELKRKL